MANMSPQYLYETLERPNSVRLLRLLPNEDTNAPIQCQLLDYTLDGMLGQPHPYEALSYVWGGSVKPCSISIDRYDMPITTNLYKALLRLRYRFLERIMWVDAACINQSDDREKEKQIQLMHKIYTHANCVIVWLGEEANDSDQALEQLRIAGSMKAANSAHNERVEKSVVKLLQRDWFRRIWVRAQTLDDLQRILRC
jgi:hypothetical protein